MSDLAINVRWQEILKEDDPQCRAIVAPVKWHEEIIKGFAKKILGEYKNSENDPNFIIAGSFEKAADVNTCRNLIDAIKIKPLNSRYKLIFIISADKLLLPAANSLLKITEEPPGYARIIFLMEDGKKFLPTLKSRSRYDVLTDDENNFNESGILKTPVNKSDWLKWLSENNKNKAELNINKICDDLNGWVNYEIENKNLNLALKLEKIKLLASKNNLSVLMLQDLIILALIENDKNNNNNFERIFNDLII